jgi:hypothetical protein
METRARPGIRVINGVLCKPSGRHDKPQQTEQRVAQVISGLKILEGLTF